MPDLKPWADPFLRWTGSKRALLPRLMPLVRSGDYIEPFAGSACLFFAARPKSGLLGDNNGELVETFRMVRAHPRRLARALRQIPTTDDEYFRVRAITPNGISDFDRAVRFLYLNRRAFNGVFRTDKRGRFNVPPGTRQGAMPTEASLYRCSVALRGVELVQADFELVCDRAKKGDFVYLDPPYSRSIRPHYGLYGPDSFSRHDEPRLARCLERLDAVGAQFLLSYATDDAVNWLLPTWHRQKINVRRQVAGAPGARRATEEYLISNYPAL